MSRSPHILIVDDDRQIRMHLARFAIDNGFRVSQARDGSEMHAVLKRASIDLIVLDIMLPGEDGLSLCRKLRAERATPIVLLTAVAGDTDRIVGLELGADDYICKPFNPRELLARVRAVLRRVVGTVDLSQSASGGRFEFDGWRFDVKRRSLASPDGALIELTSGEFDLLQVFIEHPQQTLNRDQLLDLTRGRASGPFDRSVDVQVSRLRRKIEADPQNPQMIKTVRSGGYFFVPAVNRGAGLPS
jgi:two-component system OmpR family response regulator